MGSALRARVVFMALLGVVPLALFVQWSDMQVGGAMAAGPFPPLAACLQWGALLGLNLLLARRFSLFTSRELLVILAVWMTANMVAGRGMLHPLLASLAGPTYFARSGAIQIAVGKNLPDWLAITDKNAARAFYEGYGVPVPWALWARPLAAWSLFLLPFLTANLCLCALFERAWVRSERLAFPLVALPLELVQSPPQRQGGLPFRRAVAFGLAVPLLLHGFGVAHAYAPGIPCVPFYNELTSMVNTPPWTALRPLYVNFYPLLIGLTFLAPADMTFSVWFFLLLNKAEMLAATATGWSEGVTGGATAQPPYIEEQSAGAYLALAALLVWNARDHFRRILRSFRPASARADSKRLPDSPEAASDSEEAEVRRGRLFLIGFAFGVCGTLAWSVWTGLPLWFSLGFFGFYLAVALVLSRLMAEGGVSWILAPILPDKLILSLTGSHALSPVALTRLTLHVQHLRDTRQMLAPSVFEAGKLRDAADVSPVPFYGLLLGAVCLALAVGASAALPIFYHYGASSLTPNSDGLMMSASVVPTTAIGQATTRLTGTLHPTPGAGVAMAVGALLTWLLFALRMRFLGWPLHPLGYALTGTLQTGYANKMLFSIFLGWALKALTLRFGGSRGYRLLRGVALGLILGDLLMGGILKLLDALLGPSGYAIF